MEVTQMPPNCWRCPGAVALVMNGIEARRLAYEANEAITDEYGPEYYLDTLEHANGFDEYAENYAEHVKMMLSWRASRARRHDCPGVTDLLECPLGSE